MFRIAHLAALLAAAPSLAAETLQDGFDAGVLERSTWCDCQLAPRADSLTFHEESGDGFARILARDEDLGGDACLPSETVGCRPARSGIMSSLSTLTGDGVAELIAAEDEGAEDPLGADMLTLFAPKGGPMLDLDVKAFRESIGPGSDGSPFCDDEAVRRRLKAIEGDEKFDGSCIQRQELRLNTALRPRADRRQRYRVRLRGPEDADNTFGRNNIRWVVAQWKHTKVDADRNGPYGDAIRAAEAQGKTWGASPFLAIRYNRAVLHVTAQDEFCRCLLASAQLRDGGWIEFTDGQPDKCVSIFPHGLAEPQSCRPDMRATYADRGRLAGARGVWTDLEIDVRAGLDGGGEVTLRENGKAVFILTGDLGWRVKTGKTPRTKVKIGVYKDYDPTDAPMEYSAFGAECIEPDGRCD